MRTKGETQPKQIRHSLWKWRSANHFRVYAVLSDGNEEGRLVEIGACREFKTALDFARMVCPGEDRRIVGIWITENGRGIFTLAFRRKGEVWILERVPNWPRSIRQENPKTQATQDRHGNKFYNQPKLPAKRNEKVPPNSAG